MYHVMRKEPGRQFALHLRITHGRWVIMPVGNRHEIYDLSNYILVYSAHMNEKKDGSPVAINETEDH